MTMSISKSLRLVLGLSALASLAMVPPNETIRPYERWVESPSSIACDPDATGLYCAEWEYTQPNLAPTICCVPQSALGTSDISACDLWLDGTRLRIDDMD